MSEPQPDALAAVLARAMGVPPERIGPETAFRKLATWDSFAALALIYGIEERFGVLIGYGMLDTAVTVADLQALVESGRR